MFFSSKLHGSEMHTVSSFPSEVVREAVVLWTRSVLWGWTGSSGHGHGGLGGAVSALPWGSRAPSERINIVFDPRFGNDLLNSEREGSKAFTCLLSPNSLLLISSRIHYTFRGEKLAGGGIEGGERWSVILSQLQVSERQMKISCLKRAAKRQPAHSPAIAAQ